MKKFLITAICLAAMAVVTSAQEDAEYQGWMKAVGATVGSLRKNLDAKNADTATADAKKLQEIFGHIDEFWTKKNVSDAQKFASDAQAGFGEVAELAVAGKFDDASAALKKTSATCGGCHTAHRDKQPDGSSKIK
jgi:cytochrome c556